MVLSSRLRAARLSFVVVALGAVCADDVLAQTKSIRDGVFTTEQAVRGQNAYTGPCDRCHGFKLDGASDDPDMLPAPPVAGPKFVRKWHGRTLAALVEYLRATMPANNPGYLPDAELVDIVAYMLSVSGMPPGAETLRPEREALANVVID